MFENTNKINFICKASDNVKKYSNIDCLDNNNLNNNLHDISHLSTQ